MDMKGPLHDKLKEARAALLASLDGLGEYDVRRPMTTSGTNLLGLVKHLVGIEHLSLGDALGRQPADVLPWVADGSIWDGADMWATADESRDYIIGLYERACAHADETVETLELDAPASVAHWAPDRRSTTLGFLLVRTVEETGHHAGHAEICRELIDGQMRTDADTLDQQGWSDYVAKIQAAADRFR